MIRKLWLIIALLLLLMLWGCSKEDEEKPKPTDAAEAYLLDWQQHNYSGMYARLSPNSKLEMSEEQFIQRYKKIYDGIEAKQLVITMNPRPPETQIPEEDLVEMTFDYHVIMNTIAGPLDYTHEGKLVKITNDEESQWLVEWKPSLIFPKMEEGDKVRVQTIAAERGEILDRNGNGIAVNGSAPQLGIVPGDLGDNPDGVKAKLAEKLNISVKDIEKKLGAAWVKPHLFVPIAIVSEATVDQFRNLTGVVLQDKQLRVYPYAEAAAHLSGYIGEINAEELKKRQGQGYKIGDFIGKAGLEQVLEDKLRGTHGAVISITGANGKEKAVLAESQAIPGETIKLTIDSELQATIYTEVKQDAGSVAAIQPVSGEILALLSSPSYDPNTFVRGLSSKQYEKWNNDPRHPFLNRFSKGYAPGSAFKIITAAIGLDTETLDPNEKKQISGLKWTKDGTWGNYFVKRVHEVNPVNLSNALIYSDNIYFAQLALQIGSDAFGKKASNFGIGEALPIPYPISKSRLSNDGIQSDIQLADSGYGQGQVTMSSLHVAMSFSALVNEGNIAYPSLIEEENASHPSIWKEQAMTPKTASIIKDDLIQAVNNPEGVGHGAYIAGAAIAGKTGTAELKQSKGGDGQENGWFVGFNADAPELLLAVMIEDVKGRGGSGYVTPKVKRIFQHVLQR